MPSCPHIPRSVPVLRGFLRSFTTHHGMAVAVIEGAVAALAPRAVESDRDPVPARQLSHPRYEFTPIHGRHSRTKMREWPIPAPDIPYGPVTPLAATTPNRPAGAPIAMYFSNWTGPDNVSTPTVSRPRTVTLRRPAAVRAPRPRFARPARPSAPSGGGGRPVSGVPHGLEGSPACSMNRPVPAVAGKECHTDARQFSYRLAKRPRRHVTTGAAMDAISAQPQDIL